MKADILLKISCIIFFALLLVACDDDNLNDAKSSVLRNSSELMRKTAQDITTAYGGSDKAALSKINHAITVYRIVYNTKNKSEQSVKASGIVIVPQTATSSMPLIAYFHGTVNPDGDETGQPYYPSVFNYNASENFEPFIMSVFASSGNIVIAPDYLGYGEAANEFHPYNNYSALAETNIDMIRAAKDFLASQRIPYVNKIHLTGWSEGAAAGMAVQKYIQENGIADMSTVSASFMGGSYSNYDLTTFVLDYDDEVPVLSVYGRTLLAYDQYHNINRPTNFYFQEPFASDFKEEYFPVSAFGARTADVFTNTFRNSFLNESDPLVTIIKGDDVSDWKPSIPIYLMAGELDEWVPAFQTVNAYERIKARGGNVKVQIFEGYGHGFDEYITESLEFFENY